MRTGATNAEIAVRLGLGLATVKFHIRNIRSKLGLSERDDLVAWEGAPQAEQPLVGRRWALAPVGLLLGFWKPVVAGAAITVVGGGAVAAGLLAYLIVNEEGPPASPTDVPASATTATSTPTAAGTTPTPETTPAPEATPTPDRETTPTATVTPAATATPTPDDAAETTATPTATPLATETPEETTGGEGPSVTFWGDVPDGQQVTLRARVAAVARFYDRRFGIRLPELSVHIAANEAALTDALGRALSYEESWVPEIHEEGSIFVHAEETVDSIERYYFEAFEGRTAGGRDLGPEWLAEGSAMYMAHLFRDWSGESDLAVAFRHLWWVATQDDTPLQELERQSPTEAEWSGSETLTTATLAAAWLVSQASEDALVAYYRALPTSDGWEEAFEQAFGLSPESAYLGFEAHRSEVLGLRRTVSGRILGPDGAPLTDSGLFIHASRTDGSGSEGISVAADGAFTMPLVDNTYRLKVGMVCPDSSGLQWWYEEGSGATTDKSQATVVLVEGGDVSDIVIRLPGTLEELRSQCPREGRT